MSVLNPEHIPTKNLPMINSSHNHLRKRKVKGFSLLETLFAVFLLGSVGTILAAAAPTAGVSRSKAETMNRASSLAQKELEAVRSIGYANITVNTLVSKGLLDNNTLLADGAYSFKNADLASGDSAASVLRNGNAELTLTQVSTDLKQVTVVVSWFDGKGTRSVTASTQVANI